MDGVLSVVNLKPIPENPAHGFENSYVHCLVSKPVVSVDECGMRILSPTHGKLGSGKMYSSSVTKNESVEKLFETKAKHVNL